MRAFTRSCVAASGISLMSFLCDEYPSVSVSREAPLLPYPLPEFRSRDHEQLSLVHVSVIIRHGARSPLHRLDDTAWDCGSQNSLRVSLHASKALDGPLDVNELVQVKPILFEKDLLGTCMPGQLTTLGYEQHIKLGSLLRKRYVKEAHFLPETFSRSLLPPHEFYVRSSLYDRTIESAQALLKGFFPARATGEEGQFLIQVRHTFNENMYARPEPNVCPVLMRSLQHMFQSEQHRHLLHRMQSVIKRRGFDPQQSNVPSMEQRLSRLHPNMLNTSLDSALIHGHELPFFLRPEDATDIRVLAAEENQLEFVTSEEARKITRLTIGNFFNNVVSGFSSYRMAIYSAHDSTIIPMMAALGSLREHAPLASNLIFEVWRNNSSGQRYVHILYNGSPVSIKQTQHAPEGLCAWDDFMKQVGPFLLSDEQMKLECM